MWIKKRNVKQYSFVFLIFGLVLTVNLGSNEARASNLETSTTILADKGTVGLGDIIQFTIWTYTGYDPVAFGQVRLTDLFTGEYIDTIISNGTGQIEWIVPSPLQIGDHIFLAEYSGFAEYLPSNDSCSITFEEITAGSTRSTSLQLSVNSTTVYKDASIHFTLDLFIHYRWWFQGGFITVTSSSLIGSPVIWTMGPLENYYPGTDPAILTIEFDYRIPLFSSVGLVQFFANYTGSSQSQTTPCSSNQVNVTILSSGYSLHQTINATTLNRVEESVLINTTVLGDNPSGLTISIFYEINLQPIVLVEKILSIRNFQFFFSPNSSIPLGNLVIYTELKNDVHEIYANISSSITVQDRARIQYYLNSSEYKQNETIHLEAYVTLEDIHTVPVLCQVELKDLTEGNISLMNKSTNTNGYVSFTYSLTENITIGNHEFLLSLFELDPNLLAVTSVVTIPIKGIIEFDLTYDSGGVHRNTNTQIQVTVLSGGIVINEGLVSLMFTNSTIISTQNCIAGLVFDYSVSKNHPVGDIDLLMYFHGSMNFDTGVTRFKLTIFSVPHLESLNQNATELVYGQIGRFWGFLLDEDGEAVMNEAIHFTDTTTGEYLGAVQSNAEGLFYFDFIVAESAQIGIHILQCSYQGNLGRYYLATPNPGIFTITIRPPLSLLIESAILANHWSVISIEGGLNEDIRLHWQRDGSTNWEFITVFTLNGSGIGNYNWSTPYYKGGLTLRASNSNQTNLKYDHATMYSVANMEVTGAEFGNTNDYYQFMVNCSESYQIWINDLLWKGGIQAGQHSYAYIFTSTGVKEILIVSNETYVYYHVYSHEITVIEDLQISISIPAEALVNLSINIDGTVLGEVSGPISGVDSILLVNGIETAIDSTNGAGIFHFLILFDQPGTYTIAVKVPLNSEDYYNASISGQYSIMIRSLPSALEILSPSNNSVYGSILEISFQGNADSYWYNIEPLDQTNVSWSETVFRELPEGFYTCNAYGENSYGEISFVSSFFSIDLTEPSLIIVSPRNESYNMNSVLLSFLTNEEEVFVFLDGVHTVGGSGTSLSNLSEGSHNLTIQVNDIAGNAIIKSCFFNVDTIIPYLNIVSPYNYSYTDAVPLSIDSDGETILYCISEIHSTNQTYTPHSISNLNLLFGTYSLNIYSYDAAGNVNTKKICFSVVEHVNLIINSQITKIDAAGNYYVNTEILSNPNFNTVGLYINGSNVGILEWDAFFQDYRLSFQFPSPGTWEVYLYANTTEGLYDTRIFFELWVAPLPTITSLSTSWESNRYEVRATIDSQSIDLDLVQVTLAGADYSLSNIYGNQWYTQVFCDPENYTVSLNMWYPWDNNPSLNKRYNISWYAPQIIIMDSSFERNGFSLEIRIEKANASIAEEIPTFIIQGATEEYSVNGTLIYESTMGSYQIWRFTSPWLIPDVWEFNLSVFDIYGHSSRYTAIFNSSDSPPLIGDSTLFLLENITSGVLYRLVIEVSDDYLVDKAVLYINGVEYPFTQINDSHVILEFFLTSGVYVLQISVIDDIGQQTVKYFPNIQVNGSEEQSFTTEQTTGTTQSPQSSQTETQQKIHSQIGLNDLIESGIGISLFAAFATLANVYFRRKEN